MQRWPVGWVAIGIAAIALAGCGLGKTEKETPLPAESAARLNLSDNEGQIYALLDPAERDAAERAGVRGADETPPDDGKEPASDKAAEAGISILSVALVVGAAVAPFFLF